VRIVLLNQYYAPDEAATAQLLTDLGQGLAAAGHEVSAICCRRAYADPSVRYPASERIEGVSIQRTRATGFGRGNAVGRLADYLSFLFGAAWRLFRQPRPDVVISLSTPPLVAALGLLLARMRRARSIYWVMDVYPDLAFDLGVLAPRSIAGRLLTRISEFALQRSDDVVALGECMAARLESKGLANVEVVHNWADGERIRPCSLDGHSLRREWGWSGRFVVLYSGNMGLAHEFDTVLDAAEILRSDPRVLLAFVGGGPRRAEVEEEARRRALPNVEFRPYVERERLDESLTAGDVHLVTLREQMPGLLVPSKIYGILAAGRPCLYAGPGEGEIADIIEAGRCGTRVALGNADELARAVQRYADDPDRVEAEGERARRLFDDRFSKERAIVAFQRLIEPGVDPCR
jgi:glycosyltransferase involved in cell wall biosynthesis